jgi:hypothetical protein
MKMYRKLPTKIGKFKFYEDVSATIYDDVLLYKSKRTEVYIVDIGIDQYRVEVYKWGTCPKNSLIHDPIYIYQRDFTTLKKCIQYIESL